MFYRGPCSGWMRFRGSQWNNPFGATVTSVVSNTVEPDRLAHLLHENGIYGLMDVNFGYFDYGWAFHMAIESVGLES